MSFLMKRPTLPNTTNAATQNQYPSFSASKPVTFPYGLIPFQGPNWLSDTYNWHTAKPPGGVGPPYEYCDVAAGYCAGPVDYVGRIQVNGVVMANLNHWRAPGEDYIEYTFNPTASGGPYYMRFYFGTETQTPDSSLIAGTGQNHPAYRGTAYAVFHNIDLGQGNTTVPNFCIECGRISPQVGSFLSTGSPTSGMDSNYGVNVFSAIYNLMVDDMGGLEANETFQLLDPTHWGSQAAALETIGIANRGGPSDDIRHLYFHPVISGFQDAASVISEWLSYVDGFLKCRNGQLQVGWFPHHEVDATTLPQISEQDLVDKPSGGGFSDWNAALSDATVTYQDVNQEYTQQAAIYRAPANQMTQIAKSPLNVDRPLIHMSDTGALVAAETATSFTQDDNGTTLKIMQSRAVNLDGSPLMPGDLFNWIYDPQAIEIVVRVIERQESGAGAVSLTVIYERGEFPAAYVKPPDARVAATVPTADNLTSAQIRMWFLPLGFGTDRQVACLIDRPATADIGANLFLSTNGSSPWAQILNQDWFPAKVALSAAAGSGDATIHLTTSSVDFWRMQAQNALQQANDTLLLLVDNEVFSVGSITATGGGGYDIGVLRGRKLTTAAAHSNSAVGWLFYASEMQVSTCNEFSNVQVSGTYNPTLATKYFQVQLYTLSGNTSTASPAAPGVALQLPDLIADETLGYTVGLSADGIVIACDSSGTPAGGQLGSGGTATVTTTVVGGLGLLSPVTSGPNASQFSVTIASVANCTASIPAAGQIEVDTLTALTGKVTITVNVAGAFNITKVLTLSKALAGAPGTPGGPGSDGLNNATVALYQRAASAPSVPSATLTYNFTTAGLSGGSLAGWAQSVPAINGNPLYAIFASVSSSLSTASIASGAWSTPVVIVQDGSTGGTGNYIKLIYIRQATAPSTPTGTSPYGWSTSAPGGTSALWVSQATFTSGGSLVGSWSTPERLSGSQTFYSSTDPISLGDTVLTGDTWFNLTAGTSSYYNGSSWVNTTTPFPIIGSLGQITGVNVNGTPGTEFVVECSAFQIIDSSTMSTGQAPFTVSGGNVYINSAVINAVSAGAITSGTITAAISIESPTITGDGIYIDSYIGMRYVDDNHVITITGGSDNGVSHGAQIDLNGNGLGYGISGALVLSAGDTTGGKVYLRTGASADSIRINEDQSIETSADVHLGSIGATERFIYDYNGNRILRGRWGTTPATLADVIDCLQYHGLSS